MILKKHLHPFVMVLIVLMPLLSIGFQACGDDHSHEGEAEIRPECMVVGRFVEFRGPSPAGFYEMDIEVLKTQDLNVARNPIKDEVGKTITVFTMEYSTALLPGELIAAHISLYEEGGTEFLVAKSLSPAVLTEDSDLADK